MINEINNVTTAEPENLTILYSKNKAGKYTLKYLIKLLIDIVLHYEIKVTMFTRLIIFWIIYIFLNNSYFSNRTI